MADQVFTTVPITGFGVAFFHAAIPTHWLPFVLTARVQKWNRSKTLWVTAIAGVGHILFTSILGVIVVCLGIGISKKVGNFFPFIAGCGLILFGIYYLVRQLKGGHGHKHHHHGNRDQYEHQHDLMHGKQPIAVSDRVAISSLFILLTFSPCEGFLPVYLSGIKFGWPGFFILSLILAAGTLWGMMLFTRLALLGIERFEIKFFEKYEAGILGGLLCFLGIVVIFLEH